jgi:ammonia channel protein AmtB
VQGLACAVTGVYSAVLTFGILKAIDAIVGLRVSDNDEREGLDTTQHGEEAYAESSAGMSHEMEREEPRVEAPRRAEAAAE